MDQPPAKAAVRPTGQDRRYGQEQLIQQAGAQQLAGDRGTTFAEEPRESLGPQSVEGVGQRKAAAPFNHQHPRGCREPGLQGRGRGLGGQDERPGLERALRHKDLPARRQDGQLRLGGELKPPAELSECVSGGRVDVVWGPERTLTLGPHGAGAHEYRVGKGAQQAHHEAVCLALAADQAPGIALLSQGNHAVDRRDKVRIKPG